jgi:hypothetical protein
VSLTRDRVGTTGPTEIPESLTQWYDKEVPTIIDGLESSGIISVETASAARSLAESESPTDALEFVLDRVYTS